MTIGLYIAVALLIITKFIDCYTTAVNLTPETENNPLARRLMHKVGFLKATWGLFLLVCLYAAIIVSVSKAADSAWLDAILTIDLLLVSALHMFVAHTNHTGRYNVVTRALVLALWAVSLLWEGSSRRRSASDGQCHR